MRTFRYALAVLALATVTACGGDDAAAPADEATAPPVEQETSPAPGETSTEPGQTSAEPAPSPSDAAAASGPLAASVGTTDNPDAFVITLTDASGQDVTELPAGDYEIQVSDMSDFHNVHLSGAGVDETTPVPGSEETTWQVTLSAGDYLLQCDPHAQMQIDLTVT